MKLASKCLTAVVLGALAGVAYSACSLGEGFVPTCDPNAAPDSPKACFQTSACDPGNGGVKPQQNCCDEVARQEYGFQTARDVSLATYTQVCSGAGAGGGTTVAACSAAQKQFDDCMAGKLLIDGGTGGAGTGGNSGGSGGSGGNGGSAGNTGGTGG